MDPYMRSLEGQMLGLCGGEGYGFTPTAAVKRSCLRVTGIFY